MNPVADWWKLALRCNGIALQAPEVMQRRVALLSSARGTPTAQREAARMLTEKWQAAGEVQWALWQNAWTLQQQWLRGWLSAQSAVTPAGLRAAAAGTWRRSARRAPGMAARALAPVQRRVSANAKRLRPKKGR